MKFSRFFMEHSMETVSDTKGSPFIKFHNFGKICFWKKLGRILLNRHAHHAKILLKLICEHECEIDDEK